MKWQIITWKINSIEKNEMICLAYKAKEADLVNNLQQNYHNAPIWLKANKLPKKSEAWG